MLNNHFYLFPLPIWIYDVETLRFLHVNEAAVREYGYTREEFMQLTLADIRPEEDIPDLQDAMERLKNGRPSYTLQQYRHRKKNGEVIDVEISCNLADNNGRLTEVVIVHDITDVLRTKKQAESAQQLLQESEHRFKSMVQEGSDLIAIVSAEGKFTFASDSYLPVLGYEPGELLGTNPEELAHPEDRALLGHYMSRMETEDRVEIPPFRFLRKDGGYSWVVSTITNRMDDPAIQGVIANCRDVTAYRERTLQLQEKNEELKNIAWSQSHEVRAALSRVLGLLELFKAEDQLNPAQQELLKHLCDSAAQLDHTVTAIVRRIEASEKQ